MADFERIFEVHVLPFGASSPSAFVRKEVSLDPMRHTCSAIKELLGLRGFITHAAAIVPDDALLRNWYDVASPIVVVASSADWEESDAWSKNPNQVARLLNAHCNIECALVALGRCYWQEGFSAFFGAATVLRQLVDSSYVFDYQRRVDVTCLTRKSLHPVAPFNEYSGVLLLPPSLRGDLSGGPVKGEWVEAAKTQVSTDELRATRELAHKYSDMVPEFGAAAQAVVRIFGYHAVSDEPGQVTVAPFTGFFVAPDVIMTSKTAVFSEANSTFPHSFKFTRRLRAVHGMLTDGVDLHSLRVIDGLTDRLVRQIRDLGIALEDAKVPPGLFACPWNDILLFEVEDSKHHSSTILLPELGTATTVRKAEPVYCISYGAQPSQQWVQGVFGDLGYNVPMGEDAMRTQWWSYDCKCLSIGQISAEQDGEAGLLRHNCSLLPGSRGAPLLHRLRASDGELLTYAGVCCGRSVELARKEQEAIVSMSTSDLARQDGLSHNMFNEALGAHHLTLILLYQEFIQHRIRDPVHRQHVRKYLAPFDIFVNNKMLAACHSKMLLDADDHNEYGMDFYEHHDLANALSCFREGAKMFSTASIPNLSQHDVELKTALQTNVSAVVVARMNLVS